MTLSSVDPQTLAQETAEAQNQRMALWISEETYIAQ